MQVTIFADGYYGDAGRLRRYLVPDPGFVICADGGARHALELGFTPSLLLGDFDSIPPALLAQLQNRTETRCYPRDKDWTDLELALRAAAERGPERVVIVGALGGRADHFLANVTLCANDDFKDTRIVLFDGDTEVRILRQGDCASCSPEWGRTLSLVPLSALARVSLTGVRWPLASEVVYYGSTRTISNELTEGTARLEVHEGKLAIVQLDVSA